MLRVAGELLSIEDGLVQLSWSDEERSLSAVLDYEGESLQLFQGLSWTRGGQGLSAIVEIGSRAHERLFRAWLFSPIVSIEGERQELGHMSLVEVFESERLIELEFVEG